MCKMSLQALVLKVPRISRRQNLSHTGHSPCGQAHAANWAQEPPATREAVLARTWGAHSCGGHTGWPGCYLHLSLTDPGQEDPL